MALSAERQVPRCPDIRFSLMTASIERFCRDVIKLLLLLIQRKKKISDEHQLRTIIRTPNGARIAANRKCE